MLRGGEDTFGPTLFEDSAGFEKADTVRDVAGEAHLVVAMSMVIPSRASSLMTARTSATSSGSRALVTSSRSIR